jgi:hypothetical protein
MDKPGAKALLAMKESSKEVMVFKKPKQVQQKKQKHIILTEDKYVEVNFFVEFFVYNFLCYF